MSEVRADALMKGDVVVLKGERWAVLKAKVRGKRVHLVLDGRRGTFEGEVKAKSVYDRVDPAKVSSKRAGVGAQSSDRGQTSVAPGPLYSPDGAQTRWASPSEADLEVPFDRPWDEVRKVERPVVDVLKGRLVGVELRDGSYVVPAVDDASVLGHLVTMHRVTHRGASFADAKAWAKVHDPAGKKGADEVLTMLDLTLAHETHARLHRDPSSIPFPHTHREQAPR